MKGVVHETADCEGCRIHIARAGINPTKKCMLFIHGFPECAPATLTNFQGTYHVIVCLLHGLVSLWACGNCFLIFLSIATVS